MKNNISIIFSVIIGTFLIVILPLYSILDRQDSMSYNVVLTATTNFVDNIRNNGFIDKESYNEYIAKLSSTGNTYKVKIEAYKNILISETDENGNIIKDSYIEEKELYNTKDIEKILENETKNSEDVGESNRKNNVYLFDKNDEIYVRVYNTNITSGSIIYGMIADISDKKVINISYGGAINKVNWELYEKTQTNVDRVAEVVMTVPVNNKNDNNIYSLNAEYYDCIKNSDYTNLDYANLDYTKICEDYLSEEGYSYLYDLSEEDNKTIKLAVELRNFAKIDIGIDKNTGSNIFIPISELNDRFNENVKNYIIENYIRLNGMDADKIDISLRNTGDYYVFDIILTGVKMTIVDFISTRASIIILPGLGQDSNEMLSYGGESVEIELLDEILLNNILISKPYIWKKLISTKNLTESKITNGIVYAKEEIAFVISYMGLKQYSNDEVKNAIKEHFKIYEDNATYENLEFYTVDELNEYGINIGTAVAGHVLVKFNYTAPNESNENYIKLEPNWIEIDDENITDTYSDEITSYAFGATSTTYQVLSDTVAPIASNVIIEGEKGNNDWYTSDVTVNVIKSKYDRIIKDGVESIGGSGVDKSTMIITGATNQEETEKTVILTAEGKSEIVTKAYDFIGNIEKGKSIEVKIDKSGPEKPQINLTGTKGNADWYTSDVTLDIIPGNDYVSGVSHTTYKIEGANKLDEINGTSYTLTKEGKSTIIATTYDNAGNKTQTEQVVYIEKTLPQEAKIEVIRGSKNSINNDWYISDVTLRFTIEEETTISGNGKASYKITTKDSESEMIEFKEDTHEITIDTNGIHGITVYTYTAAGNYIQTKYTVKIDKSAPNIPSIDVISGTVGENGWYTTDVNIKISANGDIGPSQENMLYYTITKDEKTSEVREINNNSVISLDKEGESFLRVYSMDNAGNIAEIEKSIKIDKTPPVLPEFDIKGEKGNDDWYKSDVTITYNGGIDNISGIDNITLSKDSITENTDGTEIILTTKDKAGHIVETRKIIKIDKDTPTKPNIEFITKSTDTIIFGVKLYNTDVKIKVISGTDNNLDKTICKIIEKTSDKTQQIREITIDKEQEIEINQEGQFTVEVITSDKAGNISTDTANIWIDKTKPKTPKIESINNEDVSELSYATITSNNNMLKLDLKNVEVGNTLTVKLINQSTYEVITDVTTIVADKTNELNINSITVELNSKGTYRIVVNQKNMYGTLSDDSLENYYYEYE